ncbi:STK33, partial [Symbiodinium natans]
DTVLLPPLKPNPGRPSTVARRENRRRQMLADQMIERTERSEIVAEAGLVADRLDSFEVLSEAFGNDVRGVTDRLEDMARSIRFENWRSKQEEKERKRREEEKRLQEEEKRKARKREQEAADPKKKVALRIENRRRFDGDVAKATIPMHPVEVDGPSGRETVSLVDVENLQSRCLQLRGKAGIEAFIDMVRTREEREAINPRKDVDALSPQSARSTGMKSSISGYSTRDSLQELTWDERRHGVLARRQAVRVETILKKLCSMRSSLPMDMCIELGSLQAYFDFEKSRPETEVDSLQTVVAQSLNGLIDNLANKLAAAPESTRSCLFQSLGRLNQCATGEQLSMSGRLAGSTSLASTDRNLELELLRARTKERARRGRAILRALARWTLVFATVRKRNRCVEMIKVTLGQLGEWARVKSAMKKAVDSVRRIQQNCRLFLVAKRERCRQIEK